MCSASASTSLPLDVLQAIEALPYSEAIRQFCIAVGAIYCKMYGQYDLQCVSPSQDASQAASQRSSPYSISMIPVIAIVTHEEECKMRGFHSVISLTLGHHCISYLRDSLTISPIVLTCSLPSAPLNLAATKK